MKVIAHLQAFQRVAARYKDNLYIRGQVERILGGLLLAEGFLGLENPLDGKKTRPGILGALIMTGLGVAALLFFSSIGFGGPVENERVVQGEVVRFVDEGTTTDSEGDKIRSCSLRVSYEVRGEIFEVRSSSGSSYCGNDEGDTVEIGYNELNPSDARVITGSAPEWLSKLLGIGVPVLFIVVGAITFLLRAVSIAFGLFFFLQGNRKIKEGQEVPLGDLLQEIKKEGILVLQGQEFVANQEGGQLSTRKDLDDSHFSPQESTEDEGPPSFN